MNKESYRLKIRLNLMKTIVLHKSYNHMLKQSKIT